MKICSDCKKLLSSDYYYNNRHSKDGLEIRCKNCRNVRRGRPPYYFGVIPSDYKICNTCNIMLHIDKFYKSKADQGSKGKGRRGSCKDCKPIISDTLERKMFYSAKRRAKNLNREFNITENDIIIPKLCPLLEIPLHKGDGKTCSNSPTLDRLDNNKGYVKGNVWVISHRANTIKRDLTVEDLQKITNNLKNKINEKA